MKITDLHIQDVKLVQPIRYADRRGYFVETWNKRSLAAAGISEDFVQDNASFSAEAGTIRGLHYQRAPAAQAKLVRVVHGSIFDVAVDIRRSSPTFGSFVSATLTASGGEQLYVPAGFAHGFCTLEPKTEVAYKVSTFYSPEHDRGLVWDDPDIGIEWPLEGIIPVLSEKDTKWPRLAAVETTF